MKPWAQWLTTSPFTDGDFYPNPTMVQWGQIVAVNPRGHGILQGSCWASKPCADYVAYAFRADVVDGRPTFQGGVMYLQPQFLVRIPREDGAYLDINPGEIADRFLTHAHEPEYLDYWLTRLTAFIPGNYVEATR